MKRVVSKMYKMRKILDNSPNVLPYRLMYAHFPDFGIVRVLDSHNFTNNDELGFYNRK